MMNCRSADRSVYFAFLLATVLLIAGNAHALQIDDFNGGDVDSLACPDGSIQFYAGAVGGIREIDCLNGGTQVSVLNGAYTHDSASIDSESLITWGQASAGYLRVDFTDGGASDRIRTALVISSLSPLDRLPTLKFFITTAGPGGTGASTGTFEFTTGVSGTYDVLLDELAWERPGNNPLNFEDVLSLVVTVQAGDADFVEIDNIATVLGAPAAVPALSWIMRAAATLCLSALGVGVLRARQAQRS
ncbi:MAG: hypothetical protein JRF61_10570 [Deltaproteobacteria bacterium]|jgi:hypothetical protein|nr:hypothetical protein [Deltaproteobacteria bacterium]